MSAEETPIRRHPERAVSDRAEIERILDEGMMCQVAYVTDGRPVVIPMLYARERRLLLLHGSPASGLVLAVKKGSPLSVGVTHLDGLVIARSAFNSSANYRSVVIHGQGSLLDGKERERALEIIVESLIPGRVKDVRPSTTKEIRQTAVIAIPIEEVSAKVRVGPPNDDIEDLDSDAWAGVVPVTTRFGPPVPAEDLRADIPTPDYLSSYRR